MTWKDAPPRRVPWNGLKTVSPMITISVRKGCTSCYFQVNNQGQKTSEHTAAMCCFLMFGSKLQTK